jgi:hypothetical protein
MRVNFGTHAVAGGRVEPGALAVRNDDHVLVGLEPGGDRPLHLGGIVDVDVFVDHDDVLDVVVARERTRHDPICNASPIEYIVVDDEPKRTDRTLARHLRASP